MCGMVRPPPGHARSPADDETSGLRAGSSLPVEPFGSSGETFPVVRIWLDGDGAADPGRRVERDGKQELEPAMTETDHRTPPPYPAEKARGGEIILRTPLRRAIFIGGLAGAVVL